MLRRIVALPLVIFTLSAAAGAAGPGWNGQAQPANRALITQIADQRERSPLDDLILNSSTFKPARPDRTEPEATRVDDELAERLRIEQEAIWIFITHSPVPDIDALEALFARYRDNKERTSSGVWKLVVAYKSVPRTFIDLTTTRSSSFDFAFTTLDRWVAAYPSSPAPHLYRASILAHQAIAIMKDPLARSTFAGGVEGLRQKLEEARLYLEANKRIAANDPHWYALMIEIMRAQAAPMDAILEIMVEGAERYPDYHPIYFETARAIGLLSRQPLKDMEALANTAVEKSAHIIGDELYARVYWVALVEVFPSDVAQRIEWNWPKMVASMRTIAERYGAQWNIQQFALFGCMMQDRATTREMLKKSRGNPIPEVWGHSEFFDACDAWASAATPKAGPNEQKAIFSR